MKLASTEEKDSYEVYAQVLRTQRPANTAWRIIQETRAIVFCLKPDQNLEATYRPVLDDYTRKSKNKFVLERMFELSNYTLVAPEEEFKSHGSGSFAILSAVGFNADRTRSAVCYMTGTWGKSGTCLFLLKNDGKWRLDDGYRGNACGFGGGVYKEE